MVDPAAAVVEKTTDATLTVAEYGKNITNTGAVGTAVLTLLAAASAAGLPLRVYLTVDQIVRLLPQTGEKIYLAGSGVATKYLNIAAVIGNYVDVFCDGEKYLVQDYSGVVTKEA
jgi:hypothetical protein